MPKPRPSTTLPGDLVCLKRLRGHPCARLPGQRPTRSEGSLPAWMDEENGRTGVEYAEWEEEYTGPSERMKKLLPGARRAEPDDGWELIDPEEKSSDDD